MPIHVFYHYMSGRKLPQSLQEVLRSIAYNKQHRISQLNDTADKYRSLCGLYLLKLGLERLTLPVNIWHSLHFEPYSKPCVDYPIEFSICHTHTLIICALSLSSKVGVDAEYFSTSKHNNRQLNNTGNRQEAIRKWTCKEAIIKAQAHSNLTDMNNVHLLQHLGHHSGQPLGQPLGQQVEQQVEQQVGQFKDCLWYLQAIELHSDYIVQIATNEQNVPINLQFIATL